MKKKSNKITNNTSPKSSLNLQKNTFFIHLLYGGRTEGRTGAGEQNLRHIFCICTGVKILSSILY